MYNHSKEHGSKLNVTGRVNMDEYIKFEDIVREYKAGEVTIRALDGVSFGINKGEICVIVGASGAGKTTLLNILGGMDKMTSGRAYLDGSDISQYTEKQRAKYRRFDIGFVFQFYNLIPNLTALENVQLASQICTNCMDPAKALEKVGLKDRMDNFPAQLSGGEQQRVAIARAIAKNPKLLLCDEPTGALDYETGKAILKLLQDMSTQNGMTVVIVTHNSALCDMADRVVRVKSGKISSVECNDSPMPVEQIEW